MSDPNLDTVALNTLVARYKGGDAAAADELVRRSTERLEQLARRMLRNYPTVRRWEDTGDVLQNAYLRLLRAVKQVAPDSTRAFFGLAAEQIRRELLDLARKHRRRARNAADVAGGDGESGRGVEPAAPAPSPEDLDRWAAFHEAVDRLPVEEREVVGLVFYHGWAQAQVAELFAVDERTVRRRWRAACARLNEQLGGELPAK